MTVVLVWGLVACGDRIEAPQISNTDGASKTQQHGSLSEVAPPPAIQQLSQSLEAYQPQVTIVSPQADEVLQDTKVSVTFQVQDLPIFKDPDLGLGPHLHVILDNQPYKAVYDLDQPLVFDDLPPGTHTLRVFASRPWHESFKNEGAYSQTTFHVFTKSTDNNPDPAQPLLTYSRPTGSYGAEPIMLDFYLTNAPLHLVAQENPDDEIADWRIRVTINGESFVLDHWQPIYLKGFKPDKNWVQLEFLDEQGNPQKNVFNDTVRLIDYQPKGKDALSKLVRGELSAEAARGIVNPNSEVNPTPIPSPTSSPSPTPSPTVELTPIPSIAPSVEQTPTPEPVTPEKQPNSPTEAAPPEEAEHTEKPKFGGFFNRFRRPAESPSASPAPIVPEETELTPQPETSPVPSEPPAPVEEPIPPTEVTPPESKQAEKPKPDGFFNRFRRSTEAPSPSPDPVVPEETEPTLQPEASPAPSESPADVEETTPPTETTPPEAKQTEKPKPSGFFSRFRRPAAAPTPSPTTPEVLEAPSPEPTVVPELLPPQPEIPPDSGLPPTLPEITETPFPKPSMPEAAFPEPAPSIDSELKSSPATAPEAAPIPESIPEKEPTASSSKTSETLNPGPAAAKPKPDLKEVFLSPPAQKPSPRIIQAQPLPESEIPSRFLKKPVPDAATPDSSTNVPKPSKAQTAESDAP